MKLYVYIYKYLYMYIYHIYIYTCICACTTLETSMNIVGQQWKSMTPVGVDAYTCEPMDLFAPRLCLCLCTGGVGWAGLRMGSGKYGTVPGGVPLEFWGK